MMILNIMMMSEEMLHLHVRHCNGYVETRRVYMYIQV